MRQAWQSLRSLNLGFDKDHLLEINLNAKPGGYENLNMNSYLHQLIKRVSDLPGVLSAGLSDITVPGPVGCSNSKKSQPAPKIRQRSTK